MGKKDCRPAPQPRKLKTMKLVAVFLADEMTTRRLTIAFRSRCVVRQYDDIDAVRTAVAAGQVLAMVVDLRNRGELPDKRPVELIAQLHGTWAAIPVIGYVDFTPQRARDILAAAHAGAAEIILGEFDQLDMIANKIVDIGMASNVAARVDVAIKGVVPIHLRDFFLFCVSNARYAMSVDSVVMRLQRSRKTLSNWLVVAQLPPPSRIVGWARVLVAARMLEDSTQSTEKIARELQFMSGTALRGMMRRYLRCSPETLRQRGGFEYALEKFVESLRATKNAVR
jgi:hypothetical protein